MRTYIVTRGSYDDEHIVDVIMEEDFPKYLEIKCAQLLEYLKGEVEKNDTIVKFMEEPSVFHDAEKDGGQFGAKASYLVGTTELTKSIRAESLHYEVYETWDLE